ncbi:aldehyde dehydrogenase family protein [Bacillus cereus]
MCIQKGTENLETRSSISRCGNHSIVLNDANLELATKQIISAAFGSAGERCMAVSVVTVEEEIADQLVERLVEGSK